MMVCMKVVVVMQVTSSIQIEVCGVAWAEARWCYGRGIKAGSIWSGYGRSWK